MRLELIPEKIKSMDVYTPVEEKFEIHLDANESFLPLPDSIKEELISEIGAIKLNRYPDATANICCRAFAEFYGLRPETVVAGNGSDELISVIMNAFLNKGDSFATIAPDFSMYAFYGSLCEGRHVELQKDEDFKILVDNVIETCNNENIRLLIFSNPCNPTSVGLDADEIRYIIKSVGSIVVLDEAYMDFWDQSLLNEAEQHDNLIILRTCSKAFGMAGIRLGFAVSTRETARLLMTAKSPYNVDSISQSCGKVILSHKAEMQAAINEIIASTAAFRCEMKELTKRVRGLELIDGCTNFLTLRAREAQEIFSYLKTQGISIRYTSGLLRITCGNEEENRRLLAALNRYFAVG